MSIQVAPTAKPEKDSYHKLATWLSKELLERLLNSPLSEEQITKANRIGGVAGLSFKNNDGGLRIGGINTAEGLLMGTFIDGHGGHLYLLRDASTTVIDQTITTKADGSLSTAMVSEFSRNWKVAHSMRGNAHKVTGIPEGQLAWRNYGYCDEAIPLLKCINEALKPLN